jgi:hypothetical protein
MGKAIKKIGNIFSPKKVKPSIAEKGLFDISEEVKPIQQDYANLLQSSKSLQAAAAPMRQDVLTQMGQAAMGKGPSLAEAQLKQAQDRTLAQQLAAVQAGRGGNSALAQRGLMQAQSGAGRDLAQQAVIERLRERDAFMNQANMADQGLRTDLTGKLNLDIMPKQALQQWEMQRVGAVNQANQANAASKNALTGALLGGAATILGGPAGGALASGLFGGGGAAGAAGAVANTASPYSSFGSALSASQSAARSQAMKELGFKNGGLVRKKDMPKYADGGKVKEKSFMEKLQGSFASDSDSAEKEKRARKDIQDSPVQQEMRRRASMPGYAEGGEVEKMQKFIEEVRRSKYAGTGVNATQAALDEKESKTPTKESAAERLKKQQAEARYLQGYERGGEVDGPGTPTSDSIPAMLSDGEFVIKAKVVSKPGIAKFLEKLNSEKLTEKDLSGLAKALQSRKSKKD